MNPNVKKVNVCITLTPTVIAMAKAKCFRDGKSLSQKIDEMLAAYACEDFDLGMPASWHAMQSNDNDKALPASPGGKPQRSERLSNDD